MCGCFVLPWTRAPVIDSVLFVCTALPDPGPKTFRMCMHGAKNHPGSPSKAAGRRRFDAIGASEFDNVVADVSGQPSTSTGRVRPAPAMQKVHMGGGAC